MESILIELIFKFGTLPKMRLSSGKINDFLPLPPVV